MNSQVVLWTGAGQIGLAIARRIGHGKKIIVSDKELDKAEQMAKLMTEAGFDITPFQMDLGSRKSILEYLNFAKQYGDITFLINAAGVSPSQASIETILEVDLLGTAILLEEVGKIIVAGGSAITISSQSGYRLPALSTEEDKQLACTPVEDLLDLDFLKPEVIKDSLHAYQLAKRCNVKRVMSEAVKWGKVNARINSISPGIVVTPLALDEFNGERGEFYQKMFKKSPAGRPGTADEIANLAELILGDKGSFITGSDFLIDGGATASFFYGD